MLRGKTDAETCRMNGWTVGTVLVGDEGHGPEKIRITAIGEEDIRVRIIDDGSGVGEQNDGTWTLSWREWVAQE